MKFRDIPLVVLVIAAIELFFGLRTIQAWVLGNQGPLLAESFMILGVVLGLLLPFRIRPAYIAYRFVLGFRIIVGSMFAAMAFIGLSYAETQELSATHIFVAAYVLVNVLLLFAIYTRQVRRWYAREH